MSPLPERLALLALLLGACIEVAPQYRCMPGDAAACIDDRGVTGRCEASGNCSFPDAACGDQGFRYDASALAGRADICVLAPSAVAMTQAQPIGSTHALAFELTTPPQTIVFDTAAPGTDTRASLHWFAGSCPPQGAEQQANPQGCNNQLAARVVVSAPTPGPYCLLAADDPSVALGHVALRIFPMGSSPPPCAQ